MQANISDGGESSAEIFRNLERRGETRQHYATVCQSVKMKNVAAKIY